MSSNILQKTKCTVIGPMQFADGIGIRTYFKEVFGKRNITVFDHYNNPFVFEHIKDDKETGEKIKKLVQEEKWNEIAKYKKIRIYDLALIDKSDFIVVNYNPHVQTCGTWEEFFWANRMKKPIFFINEVEFKLTPVWVFWTIPPKYVYRNKEEVLKTISDIDDGILPIDSDRWKLLKPELR